MNRRKRFIRRQKYWNDQKQTISSQELLIKDQKQQYEELLRRVRGFGEQKGVRKTGTRNKAMETAGKGSIAF